MLKIHFGRDVFPNEIMDVNGIFDICYENAWLDTDFAKRVIRGIDNTDHIKGGYLESPFWGAMSPDKLSTGCKNVLLMKFYNKPGRIFYGTKCGDNCTPYILEIAAEQDLELHLQHAMCFPEDIEFTAYVVENNKYIHSSVEVIEEYFEYKGRQSNGES